MAKRRACGCSSCQILREIRKLQTIVLEALSGDSRLDVAEVPKGKDPERGAMVDRDLKWNLLREQIRAGERCADCGAVPVGTGHKDCEYPGRNFTGLGGLGESK